MIAELSCIIDEESSNTKTLDDHTKALLVQITSIKQPYLARYRGIDLEVYPKVFFPLPYSSKLNGITGGDIRNYNGKRVLDIGSGTGVRAIVAGLSGAKHVVAVDIYDKAVENTRANVERYHLSDRIDIIQGDLFDNVSGYFDCIIAYLPMIPFEITELWQLAIFDPKFSIHRRFFEEAGDYLASHGVIKMVHASKGNFEVFENLIKENRFYVASKKSSFRFGLEWSFYDIKKEVNIND